LTAFLFPLAVNPMQIPWYPFFRFLGDIAPFCFLLFGVRPLLVLSQLKVDPTFPFRPFQGNGVHYPPLVQLAARSGYLDRFVRMGADCFSSPFPNVFFFPLDEGTLPNTTQLLHPTRGIQRIRPLPRDFGFTFFELRCFTLPFFNPILTLPYRTCFLILGFFFT